MRVVLVGSRVTLRGDTKDSHRYNLAMGYLKAYVQDQAAASDVRLLEFPVSLDDPSPPAGIADGILASDPEVIGISSYCWDIDAFKLIAPELRRRAPGVKLIIGGPSATIDATDILNDAPAFDVAVRGEGEETLAQLLSGGLGNLRAVPGIVFRDGGTLRDNGARPPMADLSRLRSPYVSGALKPPREHLMIERSRGCLFRCRYCAWKNFVGGIRYLPDELLEAEMAWALERGYTHSFILDSAINFDTERLKGTMGLLRRVVPPGRLGFTYFLSHVHVTEAQLPALAGVATDEMWIGLESVNNAALTAMGRPQLDRAHFEWVLDQVSQFGHPTVTIILGIPGDTLDGFIRTVDYLAALAENGRRRRVGRVHVFWMMIVPGSPLAARKAELGIKTASPGVPYLLECNSFPASDMVRALTYLTRHPARDLFVWHEADPSLHLADAPGMAQYSDCDVVARPAANIQMGREQLLELLPQARPGGELVPGWLLRDLACCEGWPVLMLERSGKRLEIQVRRRAEGVPAYVSTVMYSLSWVTGPGRAEDAFDADTDRLLRDLAEQIRQREQQPEPAK